MILLAKCDDCGRKITSEEIYRDYDGNDRCRKCDLNNKIAEALEERREQIDSIKDIYVKALRETNKSIASLRTNLKIVESKEKAKI